VLKSLGTESAEIWSYPEKRQSRGDHTVKLQPEDIEDRAIEQRRIDRRQPSLDTLAGALFTKRRRTSRRRDDHINSYIDWYGIWPLAATVTIILLCFADAFLTIVLINKGAVELNILMDWLGDALQLPHL
jgi:hypothetical protein